MNNEFQLKSIEPITSGQKTAAETQNVVVKIYRQNGTVNKEKKRSNRDVAGDKDGRK